MQRKMLREKWRLPSWLAWYMIWLRNYENVTHYNLPEKNKKSKLVDPRTSTVSFFTSAVFLDIKRWKRFFSFIISNSMFCTTFFKTLTWPRKSSCFANTGTARKQKFKFNDSYKRVPCVTFWLKSFGELQLAGRGQADTTAPGSANDLVETLQV